MVLRTNTTLPLLIKTKKAHRHLSPIGAQDVVTPGFSPGPNKKCVKSRRDDTCVLPKNKKRINNY